MSQEYSATLINNGPFTNFYELSPIDPKAPTAASALTVTIATADLQNPVVFETQTLQGSLQNFAAGKSPLTLDLAPLFKDKAELEAFVASLQTEIKPILAAVSKGLQAGSVRGAIRSWARGLLDADETIEIFGQKVPNAARGKIEQLAVDGHLALVNIPQLYPGKILVSAKWLKENAVITSGHVPGAPGARAE